MLFQVQEQIKFLSSYIRVQGGFVKTSLFKPLWTLFQDSYPHPLDRGEKIKLKFWSSGGGRGRLDPLPLAHVWLSNEAFDLENSRLSIRFNFAVVPIKTTYMFNEFMQHFRTCKSKFKILFLNPICRNSMTLNLWSGFEICTLGEYNDSKITLSTACMILRRWCFGFWFSRVFRHFQCPWCAAQWSALRPQESLRPASAPA